MKLQRLSAIVLGIFLTTIFFAGTVEAGKRGIYTLGSPVSVHKKYTMYLGTNDKDTLKQKISTGTIKRQMHKICLKYVDGYTVYRAEGYYRDDNGKMIRENTLVYVFVDASIDSMKKIMDEALIKFNQDSILLEDDKGRSTFYRGNKR